MSAITLTLQPTELAELTGFKRSSKQAEWLKANGFKFRLDAANRPRVDRAHYLSKMGGAPGGSPSGPNWSAIGSRL